MVNNEDAALRTLAQKTQAATNSDLHLRTLVQKEPAAPAPARKRFPHIPRNLRY